MIKNSGLNVGSIAVSVPSADHTSMAVALMLVVLVNTVLVTLRPGEYSAVSIVGSTATTISSNSCGAWELGMSPVTLMHVPTPGTPVTTTMVVAWSVVGD